MSSNLEALVKADIAHKEGNADFFLMGNPTYQTSTPNYGGVRYWLVCPQCSQRVRILYEVGGHMICRRCTKLPYQIQTTNSYSRLNRLLRLEQAARKLTLDTTRKLYPFYKAEFTKRAKRILKTKNKIQMYYNYTINTK